MVDPPDPTPFPHNNSSGPLTNENCLFPREAVSARVHGIVKDSWRNKARCGIACIGIKIKIFYSSWKIHHNTDATAEWKSEFLAKRIKALLCFTRKQISASFLGVTS